MGLQPRPALVTFASMTRRPRLRSSVAALSAPRRLRPIRPAARLRRRTRRSNGTLPRGPAASRASRRQPDDHRQGRPGPPALLRHAPLRQRHVRLRELPPAGARLHRRPRARHRIDRRRRTRAARCRSTNVAYNASFGWADPAVRTLEAQMARADVQRASDRDGHAGHEAEIVRAASRRRPTTPLVSRGISRRSAPVSLDNIVQRDCRVRAHAASRPTRRSIAISIATIATAMSAGGHARHEAVLLGAARLQRLPWRLQPVGPGRRSAARRSREPALPQHRPVQPGRQGRVSGRRSRPDGRDAAAPADMGRFRAPTLRNIA